MILPDVTDTGTVAEHAVVAPVIVTEYVPPLTKLADAMLGLDKVEEKLLGPDHA